MDWIIRGRKELSCSYMEAGAAFLGEDILACIGPSICQSCYEVGISDVRSSQCQGRP